MFIFTSLIASAYAGLGVDLGFALNPELSESCRKVADAQLTALALSCMDIQTILSVLRPDFQAVQSIARPSFLNSVCSPACGRAKTRFVDAVSPACGNNVLFSPSLIDLALSYFGAETASAAVVVKNETGLQVNATQVADIAKTEPAPMNVTNFVSYLTFSQAVSCVKDAENNYCVLEQYKLFEAQKVEVSGVVDFTLTLLNDTSLACSSCVASQLANVKTQTAFVDFSLLEGPIKSAEGYRKDNCKTITKRSRRQQ